jgi:hypothetical protein
MYLLALFMQITIRRFCCIHILHNPIKVHLHALAAGAVIYDKPGRAAARYVTSSE